MANTGICSIRGKRTRQKRSDIRSIENLSGSKIYALADDQVFYETLAAYEIWHDDAKFPFRVARFWKSQIGWVNTF